ncbi:hypothetical protein PVAP13_4KG035916 [Panicum virgatum]|uniref:Uncharacterized protein n=1 Tax=Panicum virgatum TaxID=38727 RepID=A0A8T0TC73_PANVG|nr:hypothetical protein PVAP13_4KG035916 [Panicum virgatum]
MGRGAGDASARASRQRGSGGTSKMGQSRAPTAAILASAGRGGGYTLRRRRRGEIGPTQRGAARPRPHRAQLRRQAWMRVEHAARQRTPRRRGGGPSSGWRGRRQDGAKHEPRPQ